MAKTIEYRVSDLETILEDLPAILNLRFGQAKAERDEMKAQISRLAVSLDELRLEVRAIPRVLAEMLDERQRGG